MDLARFTSPLFDLLTCQLFEDWLAEPGTSGDLLWTDTKTGTGTFTVLDTTANGVMAIANSAAGNDEGYLSTSNAFYLVATNRSLYMRASVAWAEANTDDAGVFVGFSDAVAASLITASSAGIKTTGNWYGLFKVKDELLWRCGCRNGTTAFNSQSLTATPTNGTTFQTVEMSILDFDGVNSVVTYKVNGQYLRDSTTGLVIEHRLAISGALALSLVFGVKNGAGAAETLNCDYVFGSQTR